MNRNGNHKEVKKMKTTAAKRQKTGKPRGRPKGSDKYLPSMDALVIQKGREGASKTQIACSLGVARSTLEAWCNAHPTFSEAMALALTFSQAWWEDLGQKGINMGKGFNAVAFMFQVKNRFPHDYRDKQTIEHSSDAFRDFLESARAAGSGVAPDIGPPNPHKDETDAWLH